jgi:hypothetical protein
MCSCGWARAREKGKPCKRACVCQPLHTTHARVWMEVGDLNTAVFRRLGTAGPVAAHRGHWMAAPEGAVRAACSRGSFPWHLPHTPKQRLRMKTSRCPLQGRLPVQLLVKLALSPRFPKQVLQGPLAVALGVGVRHVPAGLDKHLGSAGCCVEGSGRSMY